MRYHFKIHRTKKGFWAECVEYDGCITQGDTRKELDFNMREVLDAMLDEPPDSDWFMPMPDPKIKGRNIVEVGVDPKIAMATMVRFNRVKRGLTQRQVADKLGMKHIYQYQKLESGKTANPEFGTLVKIKRVFPEFSVDSVLA